MSELKIDVRIARSRQLLRESLIDLIDERGYEEITVADIARRATLNRSTFYAHYHDKEDLLVQTTRGVLTELRDCFQPLPAPPDPMQPSPSLLRLFEHVATHAGFYQVMVREKGFPRFSYHMLSTLRDAYADLFEAAGTAVQYGPVALDFFIHYLSSAHLGTIRWWLQSGMPYTPAHMAAQLTRLTSSTARDMQQVSLP